MFSRPSSIFSSRGFTLIEIMIVVGMIAIIMAFGIPSIVESHKKGPMRQAVSDLLDGCRETRAHAIRTGNSAELIINADGGINGGGFSATLDPDIMIDLIDVNFQDMKEQREVRVRFFPNGTSDEFTVLFHSSQQEVRKISLDVATALAQLEVIR
jgi:general secretion pathway protein H